jgi:predicted nucleotidyltransferase
MVADPKLAQRLDRFDAVLFALLFGSQAKGTARPDSDLDVAVFLDPALSSEQRWDMRLQLVAELEDLGQVDVVILNDAPPLLAHRALMGEPIGIRDRTAYVRFFVKTMGAAEDDRYYQEVHRAARLRRLREGRFGRP